MNTIYLVVVGDEDGTVVLAAFSTRDGAEAYAREHNARAHQGAGGYTRDEATVDEMALDVPKAWPAGGYGAHVSQYGDVWSTWWAEEIKPTQRPEHYEDGSFTAYGATRAEAVKAAQRVADRAARAVERALSRERAKYPDAEDEA